jgi:hypothetical protein
LVFPTDSTLKPLELSTDELIGPHSFVSGDSESEGHSIVEIDSLIRRLLQKEAKSTPYAFLISRLERDFDLPRNAISAAVAKHAGIPCVWADAPSYHSNVEGIRERTRLLLKNAHLVVADLSMGPENLEHDNPSRAHEIGMSLAYRRKTLVFAQEPRRTPYYGIADQQVEWWSSEAELHGQVRDALYRERADIGRQVYNWKLSDRDAKYQPTIAVPFFNPTQGPSYKGPHAYWLSPGIGWLVALSFSVLAFACALLLKNLSGYDNMLDLAATTAAVFTFAFSSRIERPIRYMLANSRFLRWVLPIAAGVLLVAALLTRDLNATNSTTDLTTPLNMTVDKASPPTRLSN